MEISRWWLMVVVKEEECQNRNVRNEGKEDLSS